VWNGYLYDVADGVSHQGAPNRRLVADLAVSDVHLQRADDLKALLEKGLLA